MKQLELNATPRTVIGKQVNALKREGLVPGILYGYGIEPIPLQFEAREAERVVRQAGSSTLVQVHVEGTPTSYTTIIRDLQRDPIKRNLRHLDLQVLNLAEKIRLPIQIILNGESPAVKNFGGLLLHLLDEVEVECLPTALVPAIEVNISGLKELGQAIFVRDLVLPPGLTVLTDADEMVAQVTAAEAEEVLAEATTEAAAEVEVIRKKKEEEVEEEKKK